VLNYIDRATLSVANKLIQDDLGIPVVRMGLLLSAFLWAYALAQRGNRSTHRSFAAALMLSAALALISAAAYLPLVREPIPA
jgi:sugar phosphate permease